MSVHFVSLKGERSSNEDNHNIILGMKDCQNNSNDSNNPNTTQDIANVNFYGIYDGHGGKFVSKFLSDNLCHFFINKSVKYPLDKQYVNDTYDNLQNILFSKHTEESTECGSTCLVVVHFKDENNRNCLNIMNTGDSRCVICRNNIGIALTKDHKPDWPDERCRISKLGGVVKQDTYGTWRINDLSVSRAFGDKESRKFVTHKPEMYKYNITNNDKFMIIACDGLWDEVSSQEAVNFVLDNCYDVNMIRINKNVNIAKRLSEYAISRGSTDNVTAIVVFFD